MHILEEDEEDGGGDRNRIAQSASVFRRDVVATRKPVFTDFIRCPREGGLASQ